MRTSRKAAGKSSANASIVACRDMLRHASHPTRLRANSIVARIAAGQALSIGDCSDAHLQSAVARVVEDAVSKLPPRQSAIIRRCDLGGERYADVARELFISKRHAFRERDAAIATILERLLEPAPPSGVGTGSELLTAALRQARTLEQNGHWQAAATLLADIARTSDDPARRASIETRLVRLEIEAERYSEAERHLAAARAHAAALPTVEHAVVDVAAARLAAAGGDIQTAAALGRRSSIALRAVVDTNDEPRLRNALVAAFLMRADIANGCGDLIRAAALAESAREASSVARGVDIEFAVEARLAAAMLHIYGPGGAERIAYAERELFACYAAAGNAGLTREAIRIVTHLSLLYRLSGRSAQSVVLLVPLVQTARLIGTRSYVAGFFHELASALLETRAFADAAVYVRDLRRSALGHAQMQPWAEHLISRLSLAERHYPDALEAARRSAAGFSRIGQERYVGTALRFEAEALARLGQTQSAIEAAQRSIEILASRSAPVRLAEAYRLLGKLTGNAAHLSAARKLLRAAHAPAATGNRAKPAQAS